MLFFFGFVLKHPPSHEEQHKLPLFEERLPCDNSQEQVVKLQDQLSGREEERQKALKREVQAERGEAPLELPEN